MKYRPSVLVSALSSALGSCLAIASASAQTPDAVDAAAAHRAHTTSGVHPVSADSAQLQRDLLSLREQARELEQRIQSSAPGSMQQDRRNGPIQNQNNASMAQPNGASARMGGMAMDDGMKMPMPGVQSSSSSMPAGGMPTGSSTAAPMPMPAGGGMQMGMNMGGKAKPDPTMPIPSGPAGSAGMNMMQMMEMMHSKMGGAGMMGMSAMPAATTTVAPAMSSALPGFPGQSRLYHIGATDFFLDHAQHIALTVPQQQMLALHKQQAFAGQGDLQRKIDAAEREMWQITGSDQPQIGNIEQKAREIERLRGDQRVAFVRAVGDATNMLSVDQRRRLTGMASTQPMVPPSSAAPAPMAPPAPMPMPDE